MKRFRRIVVAVACLWTAVVGCGDPAPLLPIGDAGVNADSGLPDSGLVDDDAGTRDAGGADAAGADAGGPVVPGYRPFALASCDDGVAGAPATGPDALESATNVVYSAAERLDGTGGACRSTAARGAASFGGVFRTTGIDVGDGDDLWIREALFFPVGFCFGYGGSGDGWGATKWNRIEFDNGGPGGTPGDRLTLELGNFADNACNATGTVWGAAREYAGNANLQPPRTSVITTGVWHMVQWQVHFDAGAAGFVRFWLDDQYLGQVSGPTLSSAARRVAFVVYGDYWNGTPFESSEWFIDDIIMTSEPPDTTDSEGQPYIAPTARVSDWR